MTLLGLVGILLGLLAVRFAFVTRTRGKVSLFAGLYLLHLVAAIGYFLRARSEVSDSQMYYHDFFYIYTDQGFGLGTNFIVWLVQTGRAFIGGTFLDYFLIFQAFGFFGIALLMRTFDEISADFGRPVLSWGHLLLLAPSLHWWSSSIGKEPPFFLATVMIIWSALHLRERLVPAFSAGALMLLIRPHIALIVLASLALAIVADRRTALRIRIVLALLATIGVAVAGLSVRSAFNVDITSAESISGMLERRESVANSEDAGTSAVNAIYPIRLLSLLFRPLFVDAKDAFSLIASGENFLLLMMFGYFAVHLRTLRMLHRSVTFVRLSVYAAILLFAFFALAYYNVGLGLRQKWSMILPWVFILFIALQKFVQGRKAALPQRDFADVGPRSLAS